MYQIKVCILNKQLCYKLVILNNNYNRKTTLTNENDGGAEEGETK